MQATPDQDLGSASTPEPATSPAVSIVIPTYQERGNIEMLAERLGAMASDAALEIEVMLMDDQSRDGSIEAVDALGLPWYRLVERTGERGLSPAVLDGMKLARAPCIIVMDADLSHPPEAIPEMIAALDDGAEFVIGSRYVPGGGTAEDWGFLRLVNSKAATFFARPFTRAKDPMAGFFGIRSDVFERAESVDPIGFKIGLELIVKCDCTDIREVPIQFAQRHAGESKLSLSEQVKYLRHVARLHGHRFRNRGSRR